MAVNLNTSAGQNTKKQVEKERGVKFKLAYIVCAVICVFQVFRTVTSVMADYKAVNETEVKYTALQAEYENYKAEAAAWHETNDKTGDPETGIRTEQRELYSAKEGGEELAELMTSFYKTGGLTTEQHDRMEVLTGSRSPFIWYDGNGRQGLDPSTVDLYWKFLTFYDAQQTTYDVIWGCYHDEGGSPYLICVKFGSYDGTTGKFKISNDMYYTTFASMLENNGAILATDDSGEVDPEMQEMIDEILEEESSGSGGDVLEPEESSSPSDESESSETSSGSENENSESESSSEESTGSEDESESSEDTSSSSENENSESESSSEENSGSENENSESESSSEENSSSDNGGGIAEGDF